MISSIFCNLETLQCNRIPQRFIVIHVTSVITWCFLQTSANVWWLWLEYLLATRHNTYIKFIIQVSCNILVLLCPDVIRQTEWMKSLTTGCRGVILYSFQYVRRENTVNSSGKRKILQSICSEIWNPDTSSRNHDVHMWNHHVGLCESSLCYRYFTKDYWKL